MLEFPPGMKVYCCCHDGCNYKTIRPGHLRRHERTHTNEKPFCCKYCTYRASRSDHLRRHEKIHERAFAKKAKAARKASPNPTPPPVKKVEVPKPVHVFTIAEAGK